MTHTNVVPVSEEDIEDAFLAYSPVLRKKIKEGLKEYVPKPSLANL